MKEKLTEHQKIRKLYNIAGERGLYVNTNFDVFSKEPEYVSLAGGAGYKLPLIAPDSHAYTSPLLFVTLTSLLNHGTMLLTGGPGIGKTTGSELTSPLFMGTRLEDVLASEILGHPQLTEEKMVASYDLGKLITGERLVIPGRFLQSPVKIIDEGNRIPPDTLSVLMKLVDTGKAIYGGELLTAQTGPLFLTANYADEGTFHFTPPFLDRFDVAVMVTSPAPWDLARIRKRGDEKLNGNLEELMKMPEKLSLDLSKIRKEIHSLDSTAAEEFADFVYSSLRFSESASRNLARATKGNAWRINQDNAPAGHFNEGPHVYTLNELTVRTTRAMPRYAKAFAWFNGDEKVTAGHLKTVLPYLLWHKIQPSTKALAESPAHENDRITFVENLIKEIETSYLNDVRNHKVHQETYIPALNIIRYGKLGDRKLNKDEMRNVVRNAITEIGKIDTPWALTLASHLASEYNERKNRG